MKFCNIHNWSSPVYDCPKCYRVVFSTSGQASLEPEMTDQPQKPREFFVAETLKGDLHIFRKNHEGGGLTKFVEYSALEASQAEVKALKAEIERCKEIAERDGKDYSELKRQNKLYLETLDSERDNAKASYVKLDGEILELNRKLEACNKLFNEQLEILK